MKHFYHWEVISFTVTFFKYHCFSDLISLSLISIQLSPSLFCVSFLYILFSHYNFILHIGCRRDIKIFIKHSEIKKKAPTRMKCETIFGGSATISFLCHQWIFPNYLTRSTPKQFGILQ